MFRKMGKGFGRADFDFESELKLTMIVNKGGLDKAKPNVSSLCST
jgi:hypothetical protein